MKRNFLFTLAFLFSFSSFVSANDISIELTPVSGDADKLPEGGHPVNEAHTNTSSFTVSMSGTPTSYVTIKVKLDSTSYPGTCGNFGSRTDTDLKLKAADNSDWRWVNDQELSYELNSVNTSLPGTLTVCCYDWGPSGKLSVFIGDSESAHFTSTVPIDNNGNGIADSWEKDGEQTHVINVNGVEQTKNGYNQVVDDETGPGDNNRHPGDGWSVSAEYRGIFTTKTDTQVTRLDPKKKDVMVCSDEAMTEYGTGSLPEIDNHNFWTLVPYQLNGTWKIVKDPWGDVFTDTGKIDTDISEDTGWVNINSAGVPGSDQRVWAIQITNGGSDKNANRMGRTSGGSPSQYTLIEIFTQNAEVKVNEMYVKAKADIEKQRKKQYADRAKTWPDGDRRKTRDENLAKNFVWKSGTDAKKTTARKLVINNTIAHEIVHDLNIIPHCDKTRHRGCFMNEPGIFRGKYTIKFSGTMVNAAGVNWGLNTAHFPDLAVTGQTRGAGNAIECDIEIEISVEAPPPLVSEEDSSATSSSSASLVSSDGIYTATAGTGHEANLTLSEVPSYVFWYVQGPGETAPGTEVKQDTSGSLTSQLSYSFPSGVSGEYVISVSGTSASGGSAITASYAVTVSLPSTSTGP